jgi:hypothetical protein
MTRRNPQSGNIIFFVLLAIFLIGLVTMALRSEGTGESQIDNENMAIAASNVRQYTHELESAVAYILQNNASETDIRFANSVSGSPYGSIAASAHPEFEVFGASGGGAEYKAPPGGVSIDPNQQWEFYAHTAIPGAGSERADLVAVLPGVTKAFCESINRSNGQTAAPADTSAGGCVNDTSQRFTAGVYNDATPNTMDETTFSHQPALQACVNCGSAAVPDYVFYDVLMAR